MKSGAFIILLWTMQLFAKGNDNSPAKYDPIDVHTAFGIAHDRDDNDDYLIQLPEYALSYNKNRGSANWVAWNLNKNWYGEAPRFKGQFKEYDALPAAFYKARHKDYTRTGYDRGHLVRSEERTRTSQENEASFFMINIVPQTPDLNRGVWLDFEYECEKLCKEENQELYLIAGGIYKSGRMLNEHIEIPDSCFKIAVIMKNGETLKNASESTKIIALIMPNVNGTRKNDWHQYITTVDHLENSTGYDFLHKLPDAFEEKLESKPFKNIRKPAKDIRKPLRRKRILIRTRNGL